MTKMTVIIFIKIILTWMIYECRGECFELSVEDCKCEFSDLLNVFLIECAERIEELESFPDFSSLNKSTTHEIRITNKNYQVLYESIFGEEISIRSITLDSDQIETIHKRAFSGILNLTSLYMVSNLIKDISFISVPEMSTLARLDLTNNSISHIIPNVFKFAKSLENLALKQNKIKLLSNGSFSSSSSSLLIARKVYNT
jgi:hypothetical protein